MANDDFHPADDMARAFQGLFNGDNIKQAMRDAWDRVKGATPPAAPNPAIEQMNKQANDKTVQDANATFRKRALDDNAAALIRAKASKALGGK